MATTTVIDREFAERWIDEHIGADDLAAYLVAQPGHTLGIYADGSVHVGEAIGREIAEHERPLATIRCPGIGSIDMTSWRADWECGHLDDAAVIRDCCENGDVEDERAELVRRLADDIAGTDGGLRRMEVSLKEAFTPVG